MNEIFEIKRFGLHLKEEVKSNFKEFRELVLILIVSYIAVSLVAWILSSFGNGLSDENSLNFMTLLLIIGILRAPVVLYGYANHRGKGVGFAMLPVSRVEKFLGMFTMVAIITPLVLLSSFLVVDSGLALLTIKTSVFLEALGKIFTLDSLYQLALISSTFLLGNLVFAKSKISKTILSIVLFWIVLLVILIVVLILFFDKSMALSISKEELENLAPTLRVLVKTVAYSVPAILFFFTYRKIKTQQY